MADFKELYTFCDYCVDKELVLDIDAYDRGLKTTVPVLWDLNEDDYLTFCKENDYDYEIIEL